MVLGFRRTKVAASGTLLGGDPVRLDGRSNLANRLATEEAQLDWRLQFLALGIFHCSGNPLACWAKSLAANTNCPRHEILNDRCAT